LPSSGLKIFLAEQGLPPTIISVFYYPNKSSPGCLRWVNYLYWQVYQSCGPYRDAPRTKDGELIKSRKQSIHKKPKQNKSKKNTSSLFEILYRHFKKEKENEDKGTNLDDLQKMTQVGLITPIGEEHMYYAAINSKSCRLTALGAQYWKHVKAGKI